MVDTIGLLVIVMITAANVQDRDGARPVLAAVRKAFPTISLVWADGGYAGKLVEWARRSALVLEIVRKPEGQRTFEVLPKRWVVERTLAWITKCRRLDHDYERLTTTSVAMSSGRCRPDDTTTRPHPRTATLEYRINNLKS